MSSAGRDPWVHRWALVTLATALFPILFGAMTTTKDAGMAFPDYPSSDGHNMFLYPWLSAASDKFLEHGHRLGGTVIGLVSIALVVVAALKEPRGWVQGMAGGVLLCVIAQGLLGGQRVLLNDRGLAFVHGSFAVLVFGLMGAVACVTSRGWARIAESPVVDVEGLPLTRSTSKLKWLVLGTLVVLFVQYVLGGLVRHRGMVLYEHAGFALVAFLLAVFSAGGAVFSNIAWLRGPAFALVLLVSLQVFLGLGAWATRFGMPGIVETPVAQSTPQVLFRTVHVLGGMFVFLMTTLLWLRAWRIEWVLARGAAQRVENHAARTGVDVAGGGETLLVGSGVRG